MAGSRDRFDVLVAGAGPAGSVAALVLARGGARVALVDQRRFPREKACGDLLGPRGLAVLAELGVPAPAGPSFGDMLVVGPTGRRLRLPAAGGATYPGHALAVPRVVLDAMLRQEALDAGAEPVTGRVGETVEVDGRLGGFRCGGRSVQADVVIGADGACSHVAEVAGLVDPGRVRWGFAVRWYREEPVELPVIAWWEPSPRRPLPGYGWLFPGPDGIANLGVGVATGADRRSASVAVRSVEGLTAHLERCGLLGRPSRGGGALPGRLGGWLKMGLAGTLPAAANVLLVGDAAGLVNPFQGEGIAQAMTSGAWAARAILEGPGGAADRYRGALIARYRRFYELGSAVQDTLLAHPAGLAATLRVLLAPGIGPAVAGSWALLWNDLVDGAPPGRARGLARAGLLLGRGLTAGGSRTGRRG